MEKQFIYFSSIFFSTWFVKEKITEKKNKRMIKIDVKNGHELKSKENKQKLNGNGNVE